MTSGSDRPSAARAALIPPDGPAPSLGHRASLWLRDQLARQAERWRLWTPVALGGGAATWFALPAEPPGWPLILAAIATLAGWLVARGRCVPRAVTLLLLLVAAFTSGLALADGRSARVAAPVAPAMDGPVRIEGWVVDVDGPGASGAARVLVAPVRISGLSPEATPVRVRLTLRRAPPRPGTAITVTALLNPPPGPASPGGL